MCGKVTTTAAPTNNKNSSNQLLLDETNNNSTGKTLTRNSSPTSKSSKMLIENYFIFNPLFIIAVLILTVIIVIIVNWYLQKQRERREEEEQNIGGLVEAMENILGKSGSDDKRHSSSGENPEIMICDEEGIKILEDKIMTIIPEKPFRDFPKTDQELTRKRRVEYREVLDLPPLPVPSPLQLQQQAEEEAAAAAAAEQAANEANPPHEPGEASDSEQRSIKLEI